ncbi:MAG: hypothetical protein VB049_04380 [Candidatus Pelethousia sp.]|nr:hypothetical protein [Candidatus Pelethousia sp.]
MLQFKMRWPQFGLSVRCTSCGKNDEALRIFLANMPVKTVQGHEMVGGWMLRDRSVYLKKQIIDIPAERLGQETMAEAPVGRISLLFPQGNCTELLVKYDACADTRSYVPIATVEPDDMEVLQQAGRLQWKSATRTKEIVIVEFAQEEE